MQYRPFGPLSRKGHLRTTNLLGSIPLSTEASTSSELTHSNLRLSKERTSSRILITSIALPFLSGRAIHNVPNSSAVTDKPAPSFISFSSRLCGLGNTLHDASSLIIQPLALRFSFNHVESVFGEQLSSLATRYCFTPWSILSLISSPRRFKIRLPLLRPRTTP